MNWKLKMEIGKKFQNQFRAAQAVDVSESFLSRVICGRVKPSEHLKAALSRELDVPVEELFQD